MTPRLPEFRVTVPVAGLSAEDLNGYYVEAAGVIEAAAKAARRFPGTSGFLVQPWKDAERRPVEDRQPRYVAVTPAPLP